MAVPVHRSERGQRAGADPMAAGGLDPLMASLAVAPNAHSSATPPALAAGPPTASAPLADQVEEVVRRIAWGGDRRRGVARIELGGEHEGTAIVVRGEGHELTLSVEARPGANPSGLSEALIERLRARGLSVTALEG